MFQRVIDDFKDTLAVSIRQTSLAAVMALTCFVTLSFLCAAAFVWVLQNYGLIQACLAGAGVFFVATLLVAAGYMARKNRKMVRPKETARDGAKSAMQSALADPMLVATGIQLIRAIGIKRLIPILAIGGVALGFLASRGGAGATDEEAAEQDQ